MAEERVDSREATWRQLFPWTELFRAFQVALDLNKLLLAAAGIAVMAFGWWLLAVIFASGEDRSDKLRDWKNFTQGAESAEQWKAFRQYRRHWNLMHEALDLTAYG